MFLGGGWECERREAVWSVKGGSGGGLECETMGMLVLVLVFFLSFLPVFRAWHAQVRIFLFTVSFTEDTLRAEFSF